MRDAVANYLFFAGLSGFLISLGSGWYLGSGRREHRLVSALGGSRMLPYVTLFFGILLLALSIQISNAIFWGVTAIILPHGIFLLTAPEIRDRPHGSSKIQTVANWMASVTTVAIMIVGIAFDWPPAVGMIAVSVGAIIVYAGGKAFRRHLPVRRLDLRRPRLADVVPD